MDFKGHFDGSSGVDSVLRRHRHVGGGRRNPTTSMMSSIMNLNLHAIAILDAAIATIEDTTDTDTTAMDYTHPGILDDTTTSSSTSASTSSSEEETTTTTTTNDNHTERRLPPSSSPPKQ